MKILKTKQEPYWADKSQMMTDQTVLNEYEYKGHHIEVIQELGFFNDDPSNIIIYRTYIKIYKDGVKIKRKLFYSDTTVDWVKYVDTII